MAISEQRVGLLFVHGIGKQKPFEFLKESVSEIAELINRGGGESVAVIDQTATWPLPAGEPTAGGPAPVTLTVKADDKVTIFECHEVYWADLGEPSGLLHTIGFWIWGLGQLGAPIYAANDAAQLSKADCDVHERPLDRPVSQLARLPRTVIGDFRAELLARFRLGLAGLAALLALASWTLLKRLASGLLKTAPSPSLIVDYVDKVRTYEERAHPGNTALSDPGFPRRVGIRRRMVTQMVAMGARTDLARWYVLAHSLGSVVAYNGLGEIGHTLPNYLSHQQWHALPGKLKRDAECNTRPPSEIPFMMPARPCWLADDDVIDRKALFARLRGFVTFGSPLGKFAAIWPRVLATATDRKTGSAFDQQCEWINLCAPLDPVAGELASFGAKDMKTGDTADAPPFGDFFPRPRTYVTSFWQPYLLAHLNYFKNAEAYANCPAVGQRVSVVRWLIDPGHTVAAIATMNWLRQAGAFVAALLLIGCLAIGTTAVVVGGGGFVWGLVKATGFTVKLTWPGICALFPAVIDAALGILLIAGLWRWLLESWYNWRLLRMDSQSKNTNQQALRQMAPPDGLNSTSRLEFRQLAATALTWLLVIGAGFAGYHQWSKPWGSMAWKMPVMERIAFVCIAIFLIWAACVQAILNKLFGKPQVIPTARCSNLHVG